ncbi:hypothetical protein D9758_004299 [Tetrapyrgos nigripes]|uniref:Thioesterase domain-containing protein n=1 Tax=Tetrapyrgos nigripes TaxID=182062 RepID=A0A8H5LVK3_9AGAR|nr:hypothetical protein D9758_004299 [Tetrapyrgos nigripes]
MTLNSLSGLPDVNSSSMAKRIYGNVSDEEKRLCARILAHFIGTPNTSYGADIGEKIKLTRIDVYPRAPNVPETHDPSYVTMDKSDSSLQGTVTSRSQASLDLEARTVCEITVTKEMCNIHGVLHGGCAMYMMDPCSVCALVALGVAIGTDGSGVSQTMFTQWHRPAPEGAELSIIATTVATNGYIRSSRCEIRDRKTNVLYVSCIHSIVNVASKWGKGQGHNSTNGPVRSKL